MREILNSSICYKQYTWTDKETGSWNKLWCAFDNIEDTQSAINEFEITTNPSKLFFYGVLQALVVQQDALRHLEESIKLPKFKFEDYDKLKEIRDIRNETIGHPTDLRKDGRGSEYEDGSVTYTSLMFRSDNSIFEYGVWSKDSFQRKNVDNNFIYLVSIYGKGNDLEKNGPLCMSKFNTFLFNKMYKTNKFFNKLIINYFKLFNY